MTYDPRLICSAFDAEGVRFVVIGGFAAAIHGSPLPTSDVDPKIRPSDREVETAPSILRGRPPHRWRARAQSSLLRTLAV